MTGIIVALAGLFVLFLVLLLWSWVGRSFDDTKPERLDKDATRNRSVGFNRRGM